MALSRGPVSPGILASMEKASHFMKEHWNNTTMLPLQVGQKLSYDAVVGCVHEIPTAMAHMILALHAMNGILIKIRQKPITTSFGAIFFHFAKTNKSGMSSIVEEAAGEFELHVNYEQLKKVFEGQLKEDAATTTMTFLPGATPEELIARCDASTKGRTFFSVLHGHDEFAGFAEEVGFFGTNNRSKVRQSDLNYVIDKGTPAKVFRDDTKGYGKDLHAKFRDKEQGVSTRRVILHQLSGMNARHAEQILKNTDALANAQAALERYVFFTAPVVNAYALPPPGAVTPALAPLAFDVNQQLKTDEAGFLRSDLPTGTPLLEAMIRCFNFVEKQPNQEVRFHDHGLLLLRRVDSANWRLADLVQYIDDRVAAGLRQFQRILAIFSVGMFALSVFHDCVPDDRTVRNTVVTQEHVKCAVRFLGLINAANAIGFRGIAPAQLPTLVTNENAPLDEKIIAKILAPAYVHLLDIVDTRDIMQASETQRIETATIALMRITLTWVGSNRVSKGGITRFLNHADMGLGPPAHTVWSLLSAHTNSLKANWWLSNVVPRLLELGLGKLATRGDGQGYCKPTVADLYQEPIKEVLRTVLDLAPEDVFHTLVCEPTPANMECSQDPIDADAEIKTEFSDHSENEGGRDSRTRAAPVSAPSSGQSRRRPRSIPEPHTHTIAAAPVVRIDGIPSAVSRPTDEINRPRPRTSPQGHPSTPPDRVARRRLLLPANSTPDFGHDFDNGEFRGPAQSIGSPSDVRTRTAASRTPQRDFTRDSPYGVQNLF